MTGFSAKFGQPHSRQVGLQLFGFGFLALGNPERLFRKTQLEVNDLLLEIVITCVVNAFRAAFILSTIVSVTARFFDGSFHLCLFPVCLAPVFLLRNMVWLVLPRIRIQPEFLKAFVNLFKGYSELIGKEQVVLLKLILLLTLKFIDLLIDFKVEEIHVLMQLFVSLDSPVRFGFNTEKSRLIKRCKS